MKQKGNIFPENYDKLTTCINTKYLVFERVMKLFFLNKTSVIIRFSMSSQGHE